MKLLFLVQKNAWFVEHANEWYRLKEQNQIALACACMALNMVNQRNLIEQPTQAGSASVSQEHSDRLTVELKSPDNKLVDTIDVALAKDSLMSIDWNTKQYQDGWMTSDAKITLDNVSSMYVDAYLPPRKGSDGKNLRIANQETGAVKTVWIGRDQQTRIPIIEKGLNGKICLSISCKPEPLDQSTDPRQLGFVLITEEAHPVQ